MRQARNQPERHTDRTDIRTDEQHYSWRGVYNLLDVDASIEESNDTPDSDAAVMRAIASEDGDGDNRADVEQHAGDEVIA
jgi:hypothetical protein